MGKRHSISVGDNVYVRLREAGRFGESFSDLLLRLLDTSEGRKR